MTGPEHYREAETLLNEAQHDLFELADSDRERMIAGAQVHATLALAAATALSGNADLPSMDEDGWIQAASEYSRGEQP